MKIYLFDVDGVLVCSDVFTVGIQEKFGIQKSFLDNFFKTAFSDCLIGKKDLKKVIFSYIEGSEWNYGVEELINFWFSYENKPNLKLLNIIQDIRSRGNICCILTNQEKYRSEYIKKTMGFEKLFDKIYTSCEIGHKKPENDFFKNIYEDIIKTFGFIEKKEIIFYDDDIKNIESGNNFGLTSFLYSNLLSIKS
ncbi:MAG: HAD-IA family hydrolase [Candidatus Gracilibacteria bacterium]|nr:HAD-IA family hydrolase [Candidatus Gracilibacteria bacterium]